MHFRLVISHDIPKVMLTIENKWCIKQIRLYLSRSTASLLIWLRPPLQIYADKYAYCLHNMYLTTYMKYSSVHAIASRELVRHVSQVVSHNLIPDPQKSKLMFSRFTVMNSRFPTLLRTSIWPQWIPTSYWKWTFVVSRYFTILS